MLSDFHPRSWLARVPREGTAHSYYDWLVHVGSLTDRIRARCPAFRVELRRQVLTRPNSDERAVLGIRRGALAWVREVSLHCGEQPLIFAHTVVPRANMRGAWNLLTGLGNRPLGALLFADPRIERSPFRYRRLDARHPLHHGAAAVMPAVSPAPAHYWARRSLFRRGGRVILVTEVFLPAILALP